MFEHLHGLLRLGVFLHLELVLSTCSGWTLRSTQMNRPMTKNAEGGSSIRPLGTYQPPSCHGGQDGHAKQAARAQQFTEETDDHQNHTVAQAVAHTIEERQHRAILHGEGSARPITMQLVMIRPTNTDSCLDIS